MLPAAMFELAVGDGGVVRPARLSRSSSTWATESVSSRACVLHVARVGYIEPSKEGRLPPSVGDDFGLVAVDASAGGVVRPARFWRSSGAHTRRAPAPATPASVPRGRCVCLGQLGASSQLPRTARQLRGAHSARIFPPLPLGRGAGTVSPLCSIRAVFRRSFMRRRRRSNRSARAQAASVRLPTTCASAASTTSCGWSVRSAATSPVSTTSGSRAPGPAGARRAGRRRAAHPGAAPPRRGRRCGRRVRRRRPSGWRSSFRRSRLTAAPARLSSRSRQPDRGSGLRCRGGIGAGDG